MNNNEYIGFAIRRPNEEGAIVYVFDVLDEGVKIYGGYRMLGETEKHTHFDDASILSITLADGTLPITIDEFNERVRDGQTMDSGDCTVFIQASMLGRVEFTDKSIRKGLDDGDSTSFRTMFYQCMRCLQKLEAEEQKVKKPKKKAVKKKVKKQNSKT